MDKTYNSGLSEQELNIEKLVDKIKSTETTLECICLVKQFIKEQTNAIDFVVEMAFADGFFAGSGKKISKEQLKSYFDFLELQIPKSFEKTYAGGENF